MGPKEPNRKQGEETKQSRWGFRGMTLRDWLELLIVPLALVVIGFSFTSAQDERQQQIEENQRIQQAQIEEQRAAAERQLVEQRAQDEALQAYLDQMGQLILERNLLEAEPGDPVHTLAQARTSTAILRLDAEHNESVTRFLIDSGLAVRSKDSASLLRQITLSRATLSDAFLANADLGDADLRGSTLSNANMLGVNLTGALADGADLGGADLQGADLRGLTLRNANLGGANLRRARLTGAVLSGAEGITNEELEQQAASLKGAYMPNGQTYEDWLKDKKVREEGE